MKKIVIVAIIILAIVVAVLAVYLAIGSMWIEGDWGTEIEIGYTDGTTDEVADVLGITYSDKDVSYFKYTLSRRSADSAYSLDMSDFFVRASIENSAGTTVWSADVVYGDSDITVTDDNKWYKAYELIVESSNINLTVGSYTLTFTPDGTARGVQDISLPSSKSLTFSVTSSGNGETRWIDVELGSGLIPL